MAGFSDASVVQSLAVPAVCLLIAFLAYFSQLIFHLLNLDPGPPTQAESIVFNTLLLSLWYTYYKAISVDPGRYVFSGRVVEAEGKWCQKCAAPKPPRAHHCRHCGRCIPKMDHHCPWTKNCVSLTTFPHFLRFLFYANASLWTLGRLLWQRCYALWESRYMPAYLGPSLPALISLALVSLVWALITFALLVMLVTTVQSWVLNRTTIDGWVLARHEAIIERGGRDWWDITGPDGENIRFERVEFPYDIGFFTNMAQAMGTSNFLLWFWPFAGNPQVGKYNKDQPGIGWAWEENGFNHTEGMWPPPDPEKLRRGAREWPTARRDFQAELLRETNLSPDEEKAAFMERQKQDMKRREHMLLAELEEMDDYSMIDDDDDDVHNDFKVDHGEDGRNWTNSEGERLRDFGVDDDTDDDPEGDDDEDIPLGELIRRRKILQKDDQDL